MYIFSADYGKSAEERGVKFFVTVTLFFTVDS